MNKGSFKIGMLVLEKIKGYRADEIIGNSFDVVLPDADRPLDCHSD
jgi:hypothetical protein